MFLIPKRYLSSLVLFFSKKTELSSMLNFPDLTLTALASLAVQKKRRPNATVPPKVAE
jgi:hypothetical protein